MASALSPLSLTYSSLHWDCLKYKLHKCLITRSDIFKVIIYSHAKRVYTACKKRKHTSPKIYTHKIKPVRCDSHRENFFVHKHKFLLYLLIILPCHTEKNKISMQRVRAMCTRCKCLLYLISALISVTPYSRGCVLKSVKNF